MNKRIAALTLAGTIALSSSAYAAVGLNTPNNISKDDIKITTISAPVETSYELLINGKKINMQEDTKQPFVNDEGILMVPLRIAAEALGYEVKWNGETESAQLNKGAQFTSITIGKDYYYFAKMAPISLKQAPEIIESRTYVPVQFFEDILKKYVGYKENKLAISNEKPITYSFDNNNSGFIGGFADLPVGDEVKEFYELEYDYREIPVQGEESKGLYLAGNNHSDDLFMYVYKKIGMEEGLKPNTKYLCHLKFDLATNVPEGMSGIGGSPGSSVYVKAGIINREPQTFEEDNYLLLNIDKGNQANSGTEMKSVGNFEKIDGSSDNSYVYKSFEQVMVVESNENGEAWIIMGTDSGFEGKTELYIDNVELNYNETTKDMYLFDTNDLGWIFDAADYPVNVKEEEWNIKSVIGMEKYTRSDINAYWLIGDNHSDDLFLYTYKKIEGLSKNTKYNASIDIEAVTPYGKESFGIGGSPAGSVYLKAGVVNVEPKASPSKYHGNEDYYLLPSTIKKGHQSNDGEHIRYISTLADQTDGENGLFNINQSLNTTFTTNENGEAWVLVGIDSGFEGLNILGLKCISVSYTQILEKNLDK